MHGLHAHVVAAAFEGRADAAIACNLLMLVVGAGSLRAQCGDETCGPTQLARQRQLVAPHLDGDVVFGDDAVVVAIAVHAGAEVALVGYPGRTHSAARSTAR